MRESLALGFGAIDLADAYAFALERIGEARTPIAHPLGFMMFDQVADDDGGYRRIHHLAKCKN